jgi:DNA-binding XRE family transcriptional regulator
MRGRRATGRYLRKHRTQMELSYTQVAEALGVHEITVRNWEKTKGTLKPIIRLAFDHCFRCKPKFKVVAPFYPRGTRR